MGLVIMRWDDRAGVEVVASYPEDMHIQDKTLMQLYSQHEFTGEAGMVSLTAGSINLASYYTGKETSVYTILILSADEEADIYEEGLIEISRLVMSKLDANALKPLLPSYFQRLSVYPTLNAEQRMGMVMQSDIKRLIMKRLRDEVVIPKSELAVWLKDQYKEGFVDIENLITTMVQSGVVKVASVKGITSDLVFLVEDILILRRPPMNLIKDPIGRHLPEPLVASYKTEVRNFFQHYVPSDADSMKVIEEILLSPQNYEVLKLLREAMVTRNDLEKLKKKGVDDIQDSLKTFWENKMIAVFQDEHAVEYYCLVSDIFIDRIFPRYNLNTIRRLYKNQSQNPNALIKALDLMKEEYEFMNKPIKPTVAEKKAVKKGNATVSE